MSNTTKLIIGFDSWTGGVDHFERLASAFKSKGYLLMLIHIGSWGHDKYRAKEEIIGELLVRDISFYSNQSFLDILTQEKPEAVLFLSTRSWTHMAFNRYVRHLGIPSCHLYHGLVTVQAVDIGQESYKTNYVSHFNLIIDRAWKNITTIIPCYARSLSDTSARLSEWYEFGKLIFHRLLGKTNKKCVIDSNTTIGCVYVEADVAHMARTYGVSRKYISVVGNPDLSTFKLLPSDICSAQSENECVDKYIIYVDTALVEAGYVFKSYREYIGHLEETQSILSQHGYKLLLKLHPAHDRNGVAKRLLSMGFVLCANDEFVDRLKMASGVIVEPSSAAIVPCIVGVPVLLAAYGKLHRQSYGRVLIGYPGARLIHDLNKIDHEIDDIRSGISKKDLVEWSSNNIGPLPAEDMPARVIKAIDNMVKDEIQLSLGITNLRSVR